MLASSGSDPFNLFYNSLNGGSASVFACTDSICLLKFGSALSPIYGYPIFKHYVGTDCKDTSVWPSSYFNSDPTLNADWTSRHDHAMDLLLGVVIFPDVTDAYSFAEEAAAALKEVDGDLIIADRIYPSLKAAIDGDSSGYDPRAVCGLNSTNGARDCFLVVYNTYDNNDYEINYDHYELFAGACRNSVSYNNGLFSTDPTVPTELTESVFECVRKAHESAFIAIGLSFVSADLLSRWGFMVLMFFVVAGLSCCTNFDPKLGVHDGIHGGEMQYPPPYRGYPFKGAHTGTILPGSPGGGVQQYAGDTFEDENPLAANLRSLGSRPAPKTVGSATPMVKGFSSDKRARGASALARRKAQFRDDEEFVGL